MGPACARRLLLRGRGVVAHTVLACAVETGVSCAVFGDGGGRRKTRWGAPRTATDRSLQRASSDYQASRRPNRS